MGWASNLLAFARDERVVLVSLGLATFGLVSTIITTLTYIRDENEIPPAQPKTQYITQDTEDSLELETLEKLLDHPNYSIRDIAIKILCDRAINDRETLHSLLFGITRPDYDERMKCLRALALLTGQTLGIRTFQLSGRQLTTLGLDGLSKLNNPKGYSALVRSLELSLDDVERPDLTDSHWDEYYLRDMAERFCLMFILELTNKYGSRDLIKARFVEKWLAKQEWGTDPEERRQNFKNYMDLKSNRIVEIVDRIKDERRGRKALEKAGLVDWKESMRTIFRKTPEATMDIQEEAADGALAEQQIPRTREHSAEEQRLRRQHREAMVLNDGTRPLGREDIIERDHGSPT